MMNVRPVSPDDAAALAAIYNYYVRETVISFETEALSVEQMRARIVQTAAEFPYLVCEQDGRVLGYACAHRWKERAAYNQTWESSIYLHHEWCARGMGRALMESLVPLCREAGCRALIACITAENQASVAFHEALGFRQVSLFPAVGCKFGRLLDVVDLYLPL